MTPQPRGFALWSRPQDSFLTWRDLIGVYVFGMGLVIVLCLALIAMRVKTIFRRLSPRTSS